MRILLAKAVEPQAALAQLLADDEQRESRQLALIDMKGRAAAHTGKQNGNWAGSRQGLNYTVQANIMVGSFSKAGFDDQCARAQKLATAAVGRLPAPS